VARGMLRTRLLFRLAAALTIAACNDDGEGLVCTDIGCPGGLLVQVPAEAVAPYTVKLQVLHVPGSLIWTAECTPAQNCGKTFLISGFTPKDVNVTVTWAGGSASRSFTPVYQDLRPNGPRCEGCLQATVVF
jgi:hypothetical protein